MRANLCKILAIWIGLVVQGGTLRGQVSATPDSSKWQMVWADEFNGPSIDKTRWRFEVNGQGGGNHELQYYTDRPANARVEEGHLVIEARKEDFTGPDGRRAYTSARLTTQGVAGWKYGRFEARLKLPKGRGLWPAFWMLPTTSVYGSWPQSGEIDIMELIGHEPGVVYGTLHYGEPWPKNAHSGAPYRLPKGDFSEGFHVFAVEWEPREFRWYVDGTLYQTLTRWYTPGGAFPAPFDQPFYLIFNVAVGGAWPGPPDAQTVFPQRMEVDYVRVYRAAGK